MESTRAFARDFSGVNEGLFSRECIQCDAKKPECPKCTGTQSCAFTAQTCNSCARGICKDSTEDDGTDNSHKGPGAGPIAGGVIGGILVIAILTYLVWRFLIKPKRRSSPELHSSVFEVDTNPARSIEKPDDIALQRRASTHTVHSIASTVLTRASNIIQIAYIPGVTHRPTLAGPEILVPPVPPIPAHADGRDVYGDHQQQYYHYGEVRDSTYTDYTTFSDEASGGRTSYAPRSSIASTIYGKQAQVQTPAQTGMRAKPTVVSVKPGGSTPPMPNLEAGRFSDRPDSTLSTLSMTSTMLNNANTATQGRAQVVKVGQGIKKITMSPKSDAGSSMVSFPVSSLNGSDKEAATPEIGMSPIPTITQTPPSDQSPFADPPGQSKQGLGAIQEDRREDSASHLPKQQRRSPFSDDHATR